MDHPEALIPYENLATRVLALGLEDLSSRNRKLRQNADVWIFQDDDAMATMWCWLAGVELEFYRGIARQLIARRISSGGTSLPS